MDKCFTTRENSFCALLQRVYPQDVGICAILKRNRVEQKRHTYKMDPVTYKSEYSKMCDGILQTCSGEDFT
jgi:hypothetical protein